MRGQLIIDEVRRIAASDPTFTYQPPDGDTCVYVYDRKPSCLIGRALWNLGYIDASLEKDPCNIEPIDKFLDIMGFDDITEKELAWILAVQEAQDHDRPWGRAIELADAL